MAISRQEQMTWRRWVRTELGRLVLQCSVGAIGRCYRHWQPRHHGFCLNRAQGWPALASKSGAVCLGGQGHGLAIPAGWTGGTSGRRAGWGREESAAAVQQGHCNNEIAHVSAERSARV